jgi:hypothetical protein
MNTEEPQTPGERALIDFQREMRSMKGETVDLLKVEAEIGCLLRTLGCELLAEAMARADTDAPEVVIDGQRWGNRRVTTGTYQSIFGMFELERSTYQQSGRGRVAVPMDLRLGIVEGAYTPKLARVLTRACAVMTDEEAAGLLSEVGLATVSSSTVNRIPRAIAARYEVNRPIIEAAVRKEDPIPEGTVTVQVGLDGVMVPQDGEYARPRGRKTDSPAPPRYELRYGPMSADAPANDDHTNGRAWHEASVGTLAFFDKDGERLKTIYVARMPEPGKATTVSLLNEELQAVVRERPDVNIAFASDGAASQWAALDSMEAKLPENFAGHTMKLVDAFHVAEYVQKGANAVEGTDAPEARILAATWRETIKEKDGGAEVVLRSMRARLSDVTKASEARANELEIAITYIANQNDHGRMQYAEAKRRKYPIGTGVTEAAAKTIVGTRMKRAGARFSQHGGQTVMLFRAALLSDRFEALHRELEATYFNSVKEAA